MSIYLFFFIYFLFTSHKKYILQIYADRVAKGIQAHWAYLIPKNNMNIRYRMVDCEQKKELLSSKLNSIRECNNYSCLMCMRIIDSDSSAQCHCSAEGTQRALGVGASACVTLRY